MVIAGLGLIGGSLARALTRAGWRVIGFDRASVMRRALRARAVAATGRDLASAVRGAHVVVLAAPPKANVRLLRQLAGCVSRGVVVTDVCSVKRSICREAERLGLLGFVGGHPMAGASVSGFAASSAELFRGRTWILVPGPSRRAVAMVRRLVRAVGAEPVSVSDAARHDRAMAFLSHLPQLVSWALLKAAQSDPVAARHLALAGPGFSEMTRLASSPPSLWREILHENRDEMARCLAGFRRAIKYSI